VFEFKPDYPDLAREAGVEGLVVVHALIGKDGRVLRVELDPKKNVLMLNAAALEAAMKWKFTPALANGHPVVVWYAIPFKFVLH
jgi:protein TonB